MTRAVVLAAEGYDATQLEYAYHRLREDAVLATVASPGGGTVTARSAGSRETTPVAALDPAEGYDLAIVPGGRAPERLRLANPAVEWLRAHHRADGILGVIGHGVQLLASIDALAGRTVTAPPELAVDVENAGAVWTDEAVAVDGSLVTARDTDALPFFLSATMSNALIPQDPAAEAGERPHWEAE